LDAANTFAERAIRPMAMARKTWGGNRTTNGARTGANSYHKLGPRKFAEARQLNILAMLVRLSTKPLIRVESGTFVGRLGDQAFALGSTEEGVARAIRRMSELRREIQTEVA
jgi:hypothetical protein